MKTHPIVQFIKVLLTAGYYLLVAFPIIVSAAQVTLQWDAKDSVTDGYRLFRRVSGQAYNYAAPLLKTTATSCTVDGLVEGTTYYFVVRSFVGDDESADSNEVKFTPAGSESPDAPDNDGDGLPDSLDSDDDNDGMPDAWEEQYDGLDPFTNDSESDLDGDGVLNLDEYMQDCDPTRTTPNTPPQTPLPSFPVYGAEGVDLNPVLEIESFLDDDGDSHRNTRYQIATNDNFTDLVYDHTSNLNLTEFELIDHILEPETTYYWRVRFCDHRDGVSDWSEPFMFTTIDYSAAGDGNANGVPDTQEVDGSVDLDQDGTADAFQAGILCIASPDSVNPYIAVKTNTDETQLVALKSYSYEPGLSLATNEPSLVTGLISFKIYLTDPETSAVSITVYFSESAPDNSYWYKYDAEEGWSQYPNAVFSADRKSVTLSIEDGGYGDQDGIRNGIIVDPAGLGYGIADDGVSTDTSAAKTGCFIGTSAVGITAVSLNVRNALLLLMACIVLGLICCQTRPYQRNGR